MDAVFETVHTASFGLIGLIATFVMLALLFGRRKERKWEYEAEFHDKWGNEIGELDIELSRIAGEDFEPRAKLVFKHSSLTADETVQVYIEDELIMEGRVTKGGRVYLTTSDLMSNLDAPSVGQTCTVRRGDACLARAQLARD